MLNPKQEQEWESQVEMAHHIVVEEGDPPIDIEYFTVLAVDAELTALRTALKMATDALIYYGDQPTDFDCRQEEWEHLPGPDEAIKVLAAIDAVMNGVGKEKAQG